MMGSHPVFGIICSRHCLTLYWGSHFRGGQVSHATWGYDVLSMFGVCFELNFMKPKFSPPLHTVIVLYYMCVV